MNTEDFQKINAEINALQQAINDECSLAGVTEIMVRLGDLRQALQKRVAPQRTKPIEGPYHSSDTDGIYAKGLFNDIFIAMIFMSKDDPQKDATVRLFEKSWEMYEYLKKTRLDFKLVQNLIDYIETGVKP